MDEFFSNQNFGSPTPLDYLNKIWGLGFVDLFGKANTYCIHHDIAPSLGDIAVKQGFKTNDSKCTIFVNKNKT